MDWDQKTSSLETETPADKALALMRDARDDDFPLEAISAKREHLNSMHLGCVNLTPHHSECLRCSGASELQAAARPSPKLNYWVSDWLKERVHVRNQERRYREKQRQWSLGDPQSLQRILSAAWPVARGLPHTTLQSLASVNQTAACAGSAAGPPMVVKASAEGPPVVVEAKQTEKLAEQEFRTYPLTNRKETAKGVGTDWNSMTWVARLELLKASPALAARTAPRSPSAAAAELEHTRKRHRSS